MVKRGRVYLSEEQRDTLAALLSRHIALIDRNIDVHTPVHNMQEMEDVKIMRDARSQNNGLREMLLSIPMKEV
jgi:hypothetical protein